MPKTTCAQVRRKLRAYWRAPISEASIKFKWLEDHVLVCDSCAKIGYDIHEELLARHIKKLESRLSRPVITVSPPQPSAP